MKFGVIHYKTPGDTLEAFLDWAAQTGFDAVELNCHDIGFDADQPQQEVQRVRKLIDQRGLSVSAVSALNDFVVLEEDQVEHQVERMGRMCDLVGALGTNVLRTEGGQAKPQVPPDRYTEAIAECLKRCQPFLDRNDIYLAVDNHGVVTNDPDLQIRIFEAVGSDRVGANLDTANYRWSGHSIEKCRQIYDRIAPYARHTHFKDCTGSRPTNDYLSTVLGKGEVDLLHAVSALRHANYQGVYCAEWEGKGDCGQAYAGCLAWMKQHVGE